jgi:pyruvate dehydrogenase E2 component (dihydrolipoamide acetyltransferase)
MRESVTTKPPVTLHTTAPVASLLAVVEDARLSGRRISLTALLASVVAHVLLKHESLNGHISDDMVTPFDVVHLGVAVDTPNGLIVPVVRDAHLKEPVAIGAEIAELAQKARDGLLEPWEVMDATFTLSTLGAYGVEQFTPIVNPPQIAVLGVGAVREIAVRRAEEWVAEPVIHLSLTFDHAAVDGAPAARFLADLVDRIGIQVATSKETP